MLKSNLLLIKLDEEEEQTDDGIFVQEEWKTKPPTGVITKVGDGVTFGKVGDKVFFNRFGSVPTPHGKDIRMIKQDDIFEIL